MKTYNEIKKELNLTDAQIAEMFGYKNAISFSTSSAKPRITKGIENLYNKIKMEAKPSHRSPKNRFRVEISLKEIITTTSSEFSFGTMTITDIEDNNHYKNFKELASKNGGAYVQIRENKKTYPEFEWQIVKNYEI